MYNSLKSKVKREILVAKQKWVDDSKHSTKKMWEVINAISGRKKNKDLLELFTVKENLKENEVIDMISERFRNFFSAKSADFFNVWNSIMKYQDDWMPLIETEWTFQQLNKLNLSKSSGYGDVSTRLYQCAAHILDAPITHIINASIESRMVPSLWKISRVTPVPKSSSPQIDSLRPISLLSIPAKLLERAVLCDMKSTLLSYIRSDQFGFRPNLSTSAAIVRLHDFVSRTLDLSSTDGVSVLFFDIEKAFDVVSHVKLIEKLLKYSTFCNETIPIGFIQWLCSYFDDQRKVVRLNNACSTLVVASSGVAQGSILGPLLYIFFVNDLALPDDLNDCAMVKYADDTAVAIPIIQDMKKVSDVVDFMERWCTDNGMKLNVSKSKHVYINKRLDPNCLNSPIEFAEVVKYLGVYFNRRGTWKDHFIHVVKEVSRRYYGLQRLKYSLSRDQMFSVYDALIRCYIEYASEAFCGVP